MPALQMLSSGSRPEVFRLIEGNTSIGRSENNFIRLNQPDVSRRHATITCKNRLCVLTNNSVSSYTIVNNARVNDSHRLVHGDIIRIGHNELMFLDSNDVDDMSDDGMEAGGLAVAPPAESDPDGSIRHNLAESGKFQLDPASSAGLKQHKVIRRISLANEPDAALLLSDPQAKLSFVLRLVDNVACFLRTEHQEMICEAIYREFPGCEQILICLTEPSGTEVHVVLVDAQQKAAMAVKCQSCISDAILNSEALLVYDLWKDSPQKRPSLSDLDRMSVMVAPLQAGKDQILGAIQLLSSPTRERFTARDLEKFVLATRVLSMAAPTLNRNLINGSRTIIPQPESPADSQ